MDPGDPPSILHQGVGDSAQGIPQAPLSLLVDSSSLTVYTDGSFQGSGSAASCGGAGVAVLEGDKSLWEASVCIGGWLSSTKAEVYACIVALASLPKHWPLQIFTDSQSLIYGFQSFVAQAYLQPFHCLLRTWFYQEWATLWQIMSHRSAPVTLNKVEAHAGNFGNELADHIAKRGAINGELWVLPVHDLPDIQFLHIHGDQWPIEGDLQSYLRMQSQLHTAVTWKYHRRIQHNIPHHDSIEWNSTILNLHHGNLPGSLVTSISMCSD